MPDREKVIKGLEEAETMLIQAVDRGGEMAVMGAFKCYNHVSDARALLKEQEAEGNKWIKCSDEMPEERDSIFSKLKGTDKWKPAMFEKKSEDVRVVVVFEDGTRMVDHAHTIDGKWDVEKHPPKRTVTHWMPNPGLPEEGR